jgi:hypothetical protein
MSERQVVGQRLFSVRHLLRRGASGASSSQVLHNQPSIDFEPFAITLSALQALAAIKQSSLQLLSKFYSEQRRFAPNFALRQYRELVSFLTGVRMSKPSVLFGEES